MNTETKVRSPESYAKEAVHYLLETGKKFNKKIPRYPLTLKYRIRIHALIDPTHRKALKTKKIRSATTDFSSTVLTPVIKRCISLAAVAGRGEVLFGSGKLCFRFFPLLGVEYSPDF